MKVFTAKVLVLLSAAFVAVFKDKLHLESGYVYSLHAMASILLGYLWHLGIVQARVEQLLAPTKTASSGATTVMRSVPGLLFAALALGTMGSCANTAAMTDAQFASFVQGQAEPDVATALGLAVAVDPTKAAAIKADALLVKSAIDSAITPLLTGANASTATLGAINAAWPQIQKSVANVKNGALIVNAARAVVTNLLGQITGGALPTATLDSRTVVAVAALFKGVSAGISDFAGS